MIRKNLVIALLLAGAGLLVIPAPAQSLGNVARVTRAAKKTTRVVVTNDTLPDAKGPANGAVNSPLRKAAMKESLPSEEGAKQLSSGNGSPQQPADASKPDREKELREQIRFLDDQLADINGKVENESNEAVQEAMRHLAGSYQQQRETAQQQLNDLTTARRKTPEQ